MSHRNARLTPFARRLIVERVRSGQPVAHVAKQWACHASALTDGSTGSTRPAPRDSRTARRGRVRVQPRHLPTSKNASSQHAVNIGSDPTSWPTRSTSQRGPSRASCADGIPRLHDCDPLTGEVIRASKTTAIRYERERPGELVHVDVKKLGRIPDGGGWRAHGRQMGSTAAKKKARIGFDYVHSMVDDHTRLAYSEIHPDERGDTCAAFIERAAAFFAEHGIDRIERVMTDNHFSYKNSNAVRDVIDHLGATPQVHPPALPLTERQGGEIQPHPPNRVGIPAGVRVQRPALSRSARLPPPLQPPPATPRPRRSPTHQPTVTNLTAKYT